MSIPPQPNYYTPRYIGVAPQTPKPTPQEEGVNPPDAFGTTQGTTSNITPQNTTTKPKGNNPWLWAGILIPTAVIVVVATTLGITASQFQKGLRITPNTPDAKATKEIPELLESIFGKKFSPEEAELAVKNYQRLLQIKDKDEFITKAVHQVKKDYGLEDVELKLEMTDKGFFNRRGGEANIHLGEVSIDKGWYKLDSRGQRAYLLRKITRELKHIEQASLMHRAGLREKRYLEELFKENPELENSPELLAFAKKQIEERMASSPYHHLPRIDKGSKEYERAVQLYEATMGYSKAETSYKDYRKNPLEIEAFHSGDEMARFIHTITQNKTSKTNGAS